MCIVTVFHNDVRVFSQSILFSKTCRNFVSQSLGLHVRIFMYMTLFIYVTHMCINICNYSQATFPSMYASLDLGNPGVWAQFASSSQCEREFPPSLMKKISPFQQVGRHYSYVHIPTIELKQIVNLLSRYRDHG